MHKYMYISDRLDTRYKVNKHLSCKAMWKKYLIAKANTQNRDVLALTQQPKAYSCKIEMITTM